MSRKSRGRAAAAMALRPKKPAPQPKTLDASQVQAGHTYQYHRPGWSRSIPCRAEEYPCGSESVISVRFYERHFPTHLRDIPADAIFEEDPGAVVPQD